MLSTEASQPVRRDTPELEKIRCCKCGRTLFKVSGTDFVRPGRRVEIKCGACNGMNHVVGVDTA